MLAKNLFDLEKEVKKEVKEVVKKVDDKKEIKVDDVVKINEYEYWLIKSIKLYGDMFSGDKVLYGFDAYWDKDLINYKYSNTERIKSNNYEILYQAKKTKKADEKIENLPSFINLKDCIVVDLKAVVYNYKGYKGKARVYSNKEVIFLRSYKTCVGYVSLKNKTLTITGTWKQTTTTHLRDFIYQYFNKLDLNHKQIKALGTLYTNKPLTLKDIKDIFKSDDKKVDDKKELKEK